MSRLPCAGGEGDWMSAYGVSCLGYKPEAIITEPDHNIVVDAEHPSATSSVTRSVETNKREAYLGSGDVVRREFRYEDLHLRKSL